MLKFEKKEETVPFVVRVHRSERDRLEKSASDLKERINKRRPEGTKAITKGDLVTEALKLGLEALNKKYSGLKG